MSAFASSNFKSLDYDSFRPQYPPSFYELLIAFTGKSRLTNVIDLGCGTGVASFPLLNFSDNVIGLDVSSSMIEGANSLKKDRLYQMHIDDESRIDFKVASVDSFEAPSESFDLITAAECIHWFQDYDSFFAAAARQLRPGATLAYWFYVDPLIVDFSGPSRDEISKKDILTRVAEEYDEMVYKNGTLLGPHWQQPGRSILQDNLVKVDDHIPKELFTDITIRKYFPGENSAYKNDDLKLEREDVSLLAYTKYISTFSSFHNYEEATGKGQELLDSFLEKCEGDFGWDREDTKLTLQWNAGYTFMKKK